MPGFLIFYAGAFVFFMADVLQKKTSAEKNTWTFVFHRSVFTCTIAFLASFALKGFNDFPKPMLTLKIIGVSFICCLGFYFYIKAVNSTKFSNVGALSIVGNAFQLLIGFIIFKEPFHFYLIPVILLMNTGCLLQIALIKNSKGVFDVLLSSFFWTIGYSALSRVLQNMTVIWSVPLMELSIVLMSGCFLFFKKEKWKLHFTSGSVAQMKMAVIGVLVFLGSYLNNLSFRQLPVSVISILQLSMMPIGYVLSLKIFKEKPTRIEWISLITGCAGFALYIWMRR